jgi:hypothetical protein
MSDDLMLFRGGTRVRASEFPRSMMVRLNARLNAIAAEQDLHESVSEAIEHLDFEPQCHVTGVLTVRQVGLFRVRTVRPERCTLTAEWLVVCRVCRQTMLMCVQHKAVCEGHPSTLCPRCDASGPAVDVFTFMPLGRG